MNRTIYLTEEQIEKIKQYLSETSACLGASYGAVRHLAHDVKAGDPDAIDRAAILMSKYVPVGSILIPIPQHTGKAEYTLKLAQRIAQLSKAKVFDVLSMQPKKSTLYMQKKRGVDMSSKDLGFSAYYDPLCAEAIKKSRNVILIDNVIDSGMNYDQSREAIEQAYGVDAWLLTIGAVTNPKDNSRDVIRSIYPTYSLEEEEITNVLCEALDNIILSL